VQIVADRYGYTDIYNGCLFRLLLQFNNTGPPDAVLYDMPLGWWDHDWKGCFKSRCTALYRQCFRSWLGLALNVCTWQGHVKTWRAQLCCFADQLRLGLQLLQLYPAGAENE
jgi:hypothetical protein